MIGRKAGLCRVERSLTQSPAMMTLQSALAGCRCEAGDDVGVQSLKAFDLGLPPLGVAGRSALLSSIISVVSIMGGALTFSSLAVLLLTMSALSGDCDRDRDRLPEGVSISMAIDEECILL